MALETYSTISGVLFVHIVDALIRWKLSRTEKTHDKLELILSSCFNGFCPCAIVW